MTSNGRTPVYLSADPVGTVWAAEGSARASSTGRSVESFLDNLKPSLRRFGYAVPALLRNSKLILGLYEAVRCCERRLLQVCSPRCAPPGSLSDPAFLLYSARSFQAPISAGGWRPFDEQDAMAFRFVAPDKRARPDVTQHPAWLPLSWLPLDRAKLAELLGLIGDPRWFVDHRNPERSRNKLHEFLCLDPRAQSGEAGDRERCCRSRLVLDCWRTVDPAQASALMPGQFLWSLWRERGGGARGDLAASKRFIDYVRQVWLMSVCRSVSASQMFAPDIFFRNSQDVESFSVHLRAA